MAVVSGNQNPVRRNFKMKNNVFKLTKSDFCILNVTQRSTPFLQFTTPITELGIDYTSRFALPSDFDQLLVVFLHPETLLIIHSTKNKLTIRECKYNVGKDPIVLKELSFEIECEFISLLKFKKSLQSLIVTSDCGSVQIFMIYIKADTLKAKLIRRFDVTSNYIIGTWLIPEGVIKDVSKYTLACKKTEQSLNNFLKHVLVVIDVFGTIIMCNTTDSSPFFVKENNILMELTCVKLKRKIGLLFFSPFLIRKIKFSHLFFLYTTRALNNSFLLELKSFINTLPREICIISMDFTGKIKKNKIYNKLEGRGCFDKDMRLTCFGGLNNNQFFILVIHKNSRRILSRHKFFSIEERTNILVAIPTEDVKDCEIEKEQYVIIKHTKEQTNRSLVFTNQTGKTGVLVLNNI